MAVKSTVCRKEQRRFVAFASRMFGSTEDSSGISVIANLEMYCEDDVRAFFAVGSVGLWR